MNEEKKEEIAFEIFEKRVEELKEMTENIGKTEKQNLQEETKEEEPQVKIEIKKKIQIPHFPKFDEKKNHSKKNLTKMQVPEPPKAIIKTTNFINKFKEKINSFNTPRIKLPEIKKAEERPKKELQDKEKQEIFANLRQLNEKIDKNKEEMYNRLIRESIESKRRVESEREELKKQMIGLLAESIDKLDSKDKEIKGELYGELEKIKNRFYGEKKEIRNIISSNSEKSRKMLENEREKIKEEFLVKTTNLRNRINEEEKKTEYENNYGSNDNKLFSLFNRFKRLPGEKEIEPDFKIESNKYSEENLEEGDILTGMPAIPKPIDLGMPQFSSAKIFMRRDENELPEVRSFSKIEEEAIDNEGYDGKQFRINKKFTKNIETSGDYERSIKNLIVPEKVSKFDSEFEDKMKEVVKKGMQDVEKKNKFEKKQLNSAIIKTSKSISKKSVYVGEQDFKNAREEIERTRKSVNNFERNFSEKAQIEKREHEKISRILEDAEKIKVNFSRINSGMLGKIKI